MNKNPKWWNKDNDSAWERVKAAFRRDWDQTKHDFGGKQPDINQDVGDTLKQAAGKQPIPPRTQPAYENFEDAHRFGFGARRHYSSTYANWDNNLEAQLQRDWKDTYNDRDWSEYRQEVRRGWDYDEEKGLRRAA